MSRVFRLHSTLEVPLETLHDYFDSDPEYPDGIEDVAKDRRNNTLVLQAIPEEDSVDKYTPAAQLKATISEVRIYEEPVEPQWGDEDPPSELIEVAGFKGDLESVLQNSALRFEMFQVLVDLAGHAKRGELTAVTERDGELLATRIVDGERRRATVEVVEDHGGDEDDGIDWRNNQYIR